QLDSSWAQRDKYKIHYNLVKAGRIFPAPSETITSTHLEAGAPVSGPGTGPQGTYAIIGQNGTAALCKGAVLSTGTDLQFHATQFLQGDAEYSLPAKIYGPLVEVTRGETVANEALGSGDSSIPFQTFNLRKSPLTYL